MEASCSKTLSSAESHLLSYWGVLLPTSAFDLPNAAIGVIYYATLLLPGAPDAAVRALTALSMATSLYLLSILVGKVRAPRRF